MAYYLKSGNTFRVSNKEAMDLHEQLPPANYVIKQDNFGNMFLETIDSFEIKGKRYGDLTRNCDRIMNTFLDRPSTTGVMLAGEKGSGKSLLAKAISMKAAEQNIPTIVINAAWAGDKFNSFIQSIDQPCVILFDEFEKVYNSDEQEQILTLLDGVFPSKKLFVLTCNDKWRVDIHMRNRPGRIYYMLDFKGLTQDFIIEYCNDNLKNKQYMEKICQISSLFGQFNFDMLKALIEEMNRYDESPEQVLTMLNAKPEFDSTTSRYSVHLNLKGVPVDTEKLAKVEWSGNPLQNPINVNYKDYDDGNVDIDSEDEDWSWGDVRFTAVDLKKIDSVNGKFTFVDEDGNSVTLTKIKEKSSYFYDAF